MTSDQSSLGKGVALILCAALAISLQDVVFKLFSTQMTLWQIFALRGVLAVILLYGVFRALGRHRGLIAQAFGRWSLLRASLITGTFLAFYAALPVLSLSTVGAANYIAPVFVALIAARVLRAPVGALGWCGVALGFTGVLLLLQPGTEAFSLWVLLPVAGAGFYALAHVLTRAKCADTPTEALSLAQNTVMMGAGFAISGALALIPKGIPESASHAYLLGPWSPVGLPETLILIALAGFAVLISLLLAAAYQTGPPAVIATVEYSYLVFAALWDILVFQIVPGVAAFCGMGMIVVAGLLVTRGDRARQRG